MKNIIRKCISVILIISLLSSIFALDIFGLDTEEVYNTVAHHHFKKLGGNVPKNVNGSCSYVATSMLLSFYDSYWHDGIIAENYEGTKPSCSSINTYPNGAPTIKTENVEWVDYEAGGGLYSDFIYSSNPNGMLIDQYFHLYLLSLGIAKGFYDDGANSKSFSIDFEQQAENLDFYFDQRFGQNDYVLPYGESNEEIPFNIHVLYEYYPGSSRETVLQIIREQVETGNPVLYRGSRLATPEDDERFIRNGKVGHAMVAYNVDDNGYIELHTGYTINSYSRISNPEDALNTKFNLNIGVLWIEINEDVFPHSCSDNYYWYPTDSNICSCNAYKELHPEHTHSNCGEFASNQTTHTYSCYCGQNITSLHNFAYTAIDGLYHSAYCTTCGYTYTEMHPGINSIQKPRFCSKCKYALVTFEPWKEKPYEEVE